MASTVEKDMVKVGEAFAHCAEECAAAKALEQAAHDGAFMGDPPHLAGRTRHNAAEARAVHERMDADKRKLPRH